jgi:Fic family protein
MTGNFDDWVNFYSEAVETQASEAMATIFELLKFKEETVQALKGAGLRGSALDLVELLLAYPVIDVSTAARLLGKTFETANQAVSKLVEHGVLRELTGRQTNRLFFCQPVYRRVSL